ncbi:cobyric acid synthase [Paenibacillus caui]|uniref:cobyric acid synthase n=1 Tax=Paenibacillus caui TaxID=2873927 RepID=UPI001F00805F|nr:cobyric acid synthase [Paenibacillus caui]
MTAKRESGNKQGRVLMLQGTASDVGKSVVTTALCRILMQDGLQPAPFKSQNMALNSYVTRDGLEIGRAQGVQAEACGIEATTDMNPVLLKPTGEMRSQIIVHGKPATYMSAAAYRSEFLPEAKTIVMDALGRLRAEYDIVLMEGAGSPAEINLKDRDIVNMNLAGWADAPVLLIADIDRGGVFAFLVGTLALLEPHERARVKGFIINKFRGDINLLKPGLDWLEERTGIPVLGVLPYVPDLNIEAEDSVVLEKHAAAADSAIKELDIAVIRYPRISNFTDFDPLRSEQDVRIRYVRSASELGHPDVIILPGSKDTIMDLAFLREQKLEEGIHTAVEQKGSRLVGICGGYQMLGERLLDPEAAESGEPKEAHGLGWLPMTTLFRPHKQTVRVQGNVLPGHPVPLFGGTDDCMAIEGYEIHMGVTEWAVQQNIHPLFRIKREDGKDEYEGAGNGDGSVFGTYLHGLFHNDLWRRRWLDSIRVAKGLKPVSETFSSKVQKEAAFDRLADVAREHLDMKKIYQIAGLKELP